jgi:hypothetical protein
MASKQYRYGLNHKVVGKCDVEKLSHPYAFEHSLGSLKDLAAHITADRPWMPSLIDKGSRRLQVACNHAELLAADIDTGMSIAEAKALPFVVAHCGLGIESTNSGVFNEKSNPDSHDKFRLVFPLTQPLTCWEDIKLCTTYLIHLLGAADPSCKDASRFFYGGRDRQAFLLNEDAALPADFLERARDWVLLNQAAKDAKRRISKKRATTLDGRSLDDFLELEVYPRLGHAGAFNWEGHNFTEANEGDKYRGCCPWHESASGTAFYCDRLGTDLQGDAKDGEMWLWHCPACEVGGTIPQYRHKLKHGKDAELRGSAFMQLIEELASEAGVEVPPELKESSSKDAALLDVEQTKAELLALLNRDLSRSELYAAQIALEKRSELDRFSLKGLTDSLKAELEQAERDADLSHRLDQILASKDSYLNVGEILPDEFAHAFERLGFMLGVNAEAFLTALLPVAASMVHGRSVLLPRTDSGMACHAACYAVLVADAGGGKSPVMRTVLSPLWRLQKEEIDRYTVEMAQWKAECKALKKGDALPEEPTMRHFNSSNFTLEKLASIQAQQPDLGFVIDADELAGLFKSFGQYKAGGGNDKEQILSGRDRVPQKVDRMSRPSIFYTPHFNILGGIQRGVYEKMLGSFEDDNGQTARFFHCLMPKLRREFGTAADASVAKELGDNLEQLYRRLGSFAPATYRLEPEAQAAYMDFHHRMETNRLNETRPALSAVWSKSLKNVVELALILHLVDAAHKGVAVPSLNVTRETFAAAEKLMGYFIGQIQQIQGWGRAAEGDKDPILADMLALVKQFCLSKPEKGVGAGELKSALRAIRTTPVDVVRGYLKLLEDNGKGYTVGTGRTLRFFPGDKPEHLKNASPVINDTKMTNDKNMTGVSFIESHTGQGLESPKMTNDNNTHTHNTSASFDGTNEPIEVPPPRRGTPEKINKGTPQKVSFCHLTGCDALPVSDTANDTSVISLSQMSDVSFKEFQENDLGAGLGEMSGSSGAADSSNMTSVIFGGDFSGLGELMAACASRDELEALGTPIPGDVWESTWAELPPVVQKRLSRLLKAA